MIMRLLQTMHLATDMAALTGDSPTEQAGHEPMAPSAPLSAATPRTFAGQPMDTLRAICRPRHAGRIRRSHHTSTPEAWYCICVEWLRLPKASLPWNTWQAISSCPYTEVAAFRQGLLLWQMLPDTPHELIQRLPPPGHVLKVLELLVTDHRASVAEVTVLERALLEHVDRHGAWTP
jgi:hypothetical protein